jgi:diacylglycerol kinase family enzyme
VNAEIAVVLNIYSGPRRGKAHADLVDLFFEHKIKAQFLPSATGAAVRDNAARAVDTGYPIIAAAGGDGTVGTVAGIVAGTRSILGVLPLGTFNHFARDAGIPQDVGSAVLTLKTGRPTCVDVAAVNGRMFVNTSSIGVYPRLVLEREHYRRTGAGRTLAMVAATTSTLRRFSGLYVRVAAEHAAWEGFAPFVFVGNNRYVFEGSRLASREALNGGVLSVYMSAETGRWGFFRMAAQAWAGRLSQNPNFRAMVTQTLSVDCDRASVHVSLDGEVERVATPLQYRILPRALQVLAP